MLAALYELVRGFQAADDQRKGQLLADVLREDPNHVYAGLLTVLMRLVFVLYAEDRNLLSSDPVYANFYSVTGLFERLRTDEGRYTDTMDQRFGAWAQLLTLFRMVYEGGRHGDLRIPGRKGYLFDPDRYNFLEGRAWKTPRQPDDKPEIPHVSDGVVYRVLQNLLILDGERLSYRTLDVEQIGSVYETVMGFNLQVAEGRSIAIKPTKSHGAPATINLEALLAAKPGRPRQMARGTDRSEGHRPGRRRAEEGGQPGRPAGGPGKEDRLARHAQRQRPRGRWSSSPPTSAAAAVRITRRGRSPSRSSAPRCGRCWSGCPEGIGSRE